MLAALGEDVLGEGAEEDSAADTSMSTRVKPNASDFGVVTGHVGV
jgi:hypothetical protein